jgi:hypothetical protein
MDRALATVALEIDCRRDQYRSRMGRCPIDNIEHPEALHPQRSWNKGTDSDSLSLVLITSYRDPDAS